MFFRDIRTDYRSRSPRCIASGREAKGNKGSRQNSVVRLQESVALKMLDSKKEHLLFSK